MLFVRRLGLITHGSSHHMRMINGKACAYVRMKYKWCVMKIKLYIDAKRGIWFNDHSEHCHVYNQLQHTYVETNTKFYQYLNKDTPKKNWIQSSKTCTYVYKQTDWNVLNTLWSTLGVCNTIPHKRDLTGTRKTRFY